MNTLRRNWFLVALVLFLGVGPFLTGTVINRVLDLLSMDLLTAVILLLMSFSLETTQMRRALLSPRPVLLGLAVNTFVMPLIGMGFSSFQQIDEFHYGLVIAMSVPSTMSTAVFCTHRGGGNVAATLLVIVLTNSLGVLMIPFWIEWGCAAELHLSVWDILSRVCLIALLPVISGQVLQMSAAVRHVLVPHRSSFHQWSQYGVLLTVFKTSVNYGQPVWQQLSAGNLTFSIVVLSTSIIGMHIAGLFAAWLIGKFFRLSLTDQFAVMIVGSQKTLANAIAISNFPLFGDGTLVALLVLPAILHHVLQIMIDTWLAEWWQMTNHVRKSPSDESMPRSMEAGNSAEKIVR